MIESKHRHDPVLRELRAFGLAYPGAGTKSPWPEHLDLVVGGKTFAFLRVFGFPLRVCCKLPQSGEAALTLPFAEPARYGLGKSGWVVATFEGDEDPPLSLLKEWIDESYRAVAPKRLVEGLKERASAEPTKRKGKSAPVGKASERSTRASKPSRRNAPR